MSETPTSSRASWRQRVAGQWNDFFFADEPVYPAVYFRVFLGLWTVAFFLPRLPHLPELYTEAGVHIPHPWIARWNVMPDLPLWAAWLAVIALLVCAVAFAAGYHARKVHLPIILLLCYLLGYDVSTVRGYGQLAFYQWLVVYCLPYDCLPYDALDDSTGGVLLAPRWGRRLATMLFSSVYLFSVLAKTIGGEGWFDGRTLYYTLRGHDYGNFLVSAWFPISLGTARVFGWMTLATECFIGLCLWHRRTVRWGMLACVGMHTVMALTMRVSILFHLLMVGHLPLFFQPRTWQRLWAMTRPAPALSEPRRNLP